MIAHAAFYRNKCGSDFWSFATDGVAECKQRELLAKDGIFSRMWKKLPDFRAMEGNKGGAVI